MRRHTADELAWDLVEHIRSHLDVAQLNTLFVKLGVGDHEFVIRLILRRLPRIGASLTPELLSRSQVWIDGYRDHTDYPWLLELLAATHPTALVTRHSWPWQRGSPSI
jgi:hypothetical protein